MAITRVTLLIIILQFALCTNKTYGQYDEFTLLPDSETVHLNIDLRENRVKIRILNLSEELMYRGLVVRNINNTCSGSSKIEMSQFFIELKGNYSRADTFIVYLFAHDWDLKYPAEAFHFSNSTSQVTLGANCYKLNCIPRNDPWMPTAYRPFLFMKNGFYLNPANGKIRKGTKLVNSGNYSICDLEKWNYISPYGLYIDKQGNKFRGSDLIKAGKINIADWNLKVFSLYWYLS